MQIPIYQIDAFADGVFGGNPAAICPLEEWLGDDAMQAIAAENNLSETAFFVPHTDKADGDYDLRWFTPACEVDLCGHATLATSHLIFTRLFPEKDRVRFSTRSGTLEISRNGDLITMDFPSLPPEPCAAPDGLVAALGSEPAELLAVKWKYMAVFEDESMVRKISPDMQGLSALDKTGVSVTAPGRDYDFVSRFFAPKAGIPEDPVTGSAHCTLTPYWAGRLDKTRLRARQVSPRGGDVECELVGDRVRLSGRAAFYLEGTISVPDSAAKTEK